MHSIHNDIDKSLACTVYVCYHK